MTEDDWLEENQEHIDWPATLRVMCSRISFSPRASLELTSIAEDVYALAISAKSWNGLSDDTYEAWAKNWWAIISSIEKGEDACWD